MALLEVGRYCVKKYGRDAGSRAVVTKVIDSNFVEIVTSERAKPRKCNVKHLEFLPGKTDSVDKASLAKYLEIDQAKLK